MRIFVNKKCILKTPNIQNFSFPDNIIYYITKFPSSHKVYQKLIQTCAYFYSKNSIFVFQWLRFFDQNWYYEVVKTIDIEKCRHQLWLSNVLLIDGGFKQNIIGSLLSKVYRCDLSMLTIVDSNISFDEYKILTKSNTIMNLCFHNVIIRHNNNGKIVTFDKFIECLPAIKYLRCTFKDNSHLNFTSETTEKMYHLRKFQNLEHFDISGMPDTINTTHFCAFINKHNAFYRINFFPTVSTVFQNQFKAILEQNFITCETSSSTFPTFMISQAKKEKALK